MLKNIHRRECQCSVSALSNRAQRSQNPVAIPCRFIQIDRNGAPVKCVSGHPIILQTSREKRVQYLREQPARLISAVGPIVSGEKSLDPAKNFVLDVQDFPNLELGYLAELRNRMTLAVERRRRKVSPDLPQNVKTWRNEFLVVLSQWLQQRRKSFENM